MKIAIDIFGCYDKDPQTWDKVITLLRDNGHEVIAISGAHNGAPKHDGWRQLTELGVKVYWTAGQAKKIYLKRKHGIEVDVVIDDNPIKWVKSTR